MNKKIIFGVVFIVGLLIDIISKEFVVKYFSTSQMPFISIIDGFLNVGLTYNKGVAFGMMTSWSDSVRFFALIFTSSIAFFVLLYFLFVVYRNNKIGICFLALIFSGAIGNIIDRVRYGAVVDFIDVFYGSYHWPMFNCADSFICIGVIGLIFLPTKEDSEKNAK